MENKIKDLLEMLDSADEDDIYDAIIDIGKGGFVNEENNIAKFLTHKEATIRSAAIRVLGFYWQIEKYREVAKDILLNDDDNETRSVALMAYSSYYRNQNNKNIIEFIYRFLIDKNEAPIIRASAFDAILAVSLIAAKDWPLINDLENIDNEVDWKLIKKIIDEAG